MNHILGGAIVEITITLAIAIVAIGCQPEPAAPEDEDGATVPAMPSGIEATLGDGQITLVWDESDDASTYDIYRGVGDEEPGDEVYATVAAGSVGGIGYVDSGLVNGTFYRYAIAARNSAGSSQRSPVVGAIPSALAISVDGDPDMAGIQPIAAIPERAGGAQIIISSFQAIAPGDATPIENVSYSIAAAPDGHPFAIVGDELVLLEGAAIDYEETPSFDLAIVGGAAGGKIGLVSIAIAIANIDDEAPMFGDISDPIAIESGTARFITGSPTIRATDDLGSEIKYAFLQTGGTTTDTIGGFSIASDAGTIAVDAAPVYNTDDLAANSRALTVQARDSSPGAIGDLVATVDITIVILPESSIKLASSAGTAFTINESDDSSIAATAISFVDTSLTPATIDPYAILDPPSGIAIDGNGMITASVDYDALLPNQRENGLSMIVQAEDSEGDRGVIVLTITITNIDDEAPEFISFPMAAAIASGSASFQGGDLVINATDDEGDEIGYSFLNTDGTTTDISGYFSIDHTTGVISATAAPVYDIAGRLDSNRRMLTVRTTDRSDNAVGAIVADDDIVIEVLPIVDADGNGLIDIATLEQLNNIRYNLSGTAYKDSASGSGSTIGCPMPGGCDGYELTRSLDFADAASYATGAVNDSWRPNNSDLATADNPGWEPIASNFARFNAIFEGNGNTIANLYSRGDGDRGLFGGIGRDAAIRNVGIIDGAIYGGNGPDDAGLLVGEVTGGTIFASYAGGTVNGGDGRDAVGGLVGRGSGDIVASYATASVNGGDMTDTVGGLIGISGGDIIASYAIGDADGGAGNLDVVGGLIGWNNDGTIVASYAIGDADSGAGSTDVSGALVGLNVGSIAASYGFGAIRGEDFRGPDRSDDADPSIHSPAVIVSAAPWSGAVWNFGGARLYPVIQWITDYDSDAQTFSCDQARIPDGHACGAPIPGQYDSDGDGERDMTPAAPAAPTATFTAVDITVTWTPVDGATAYRVYRNAVARENALNYRPIAIIDGDSPRSYIDSAPLAGANRYAISAVNDAGEGERSPALSVIIAVDGDGDGLIDISTLEQLNNIRYNLSGTSYKISESDSGSTEGCPMPAGCNGYELTRSLDFADAASYATGAINDSWRPNDSDSAMADNEGWIPIATLPSTLDALFEGNGNTIANLYSRGDGARGLFGKIGKDAAVRNVGIIRGAVYGGDGTDHIGLLAGVNEGGTITASYAAGDANGGAGDFDEVGSLVGANNGGSIVASYATGDADGGDGSDVVGGLVGENRGAIIASYATGDADGGSNVGGLVGRNSSGTIIASYATGGAVGGANHNDQIGGLVGYNSRTIIASYATGDADGGAGSGDRVGGLVGYSGGTIIASYATGVVDGGAGSFDRAGVLVGEPIGAITASYGFGSVIGEETPNTEGAHPDGLTDAAALTEANAGAQWNDAANDTLNAWNFGSGSIPPALRYADYDGTGTDYDCDIFPDTIPGGSIIACGATLIPEQGGRQAAGGGEVSPRAP